MNGSVLKRYAAAALLLGASALSHGVQIEEIEFDVSKATIADPSAPYISHWTATSPDGVTFSADKCAFLKDGKPFPLTVGEVHPQRFPAELWEDAIIEMKAGGLNVIAQYWFWSLFEPNKGEFDFTGNNDVRRFVELCKKHDMLVFLRPGPFCNAEFLNGGLPPWIYGLPARERSNDPVYLEHVQMYFNALGEQLAGMTWEKGGPIFMMQLENELGVAPLGWYYLYGHGAGDEHRGPEDPEEFWNHYLNLKKIGKNAGFNVPFYTLTGWGPKHVRAKLKQDHNFTFSFGGYMYLGRPNPDMNGWLTLMQPDPEIISVQEPYPLSFIELGAAGSPQRLGYVAIPPPESAMSTVMSRLGTHKSINAGWYMYQGGTNPKLPNWGPTMKHDGLGLSYDYNAPLSEYGYERPAYYLLRRFHQTLLNFGDRFCYGEIFYQNPMVRAHEDKARASVRMGTNDGGVLMISHYGNHKPLSTRDASFKIKTASGEVSIPTEGKLRLTNGDFAVLPFNWDLGYGVKLVSSTATPSGKIEQDRTLTMICSTGSDQEGEFVFDLPSGAKLETSGSQRKVGQQTIVKIHPAMDSLIRIKTGEGEITFAVIPQEKIYRSVEKMFNGRKTYLVSNHDLVIEKIEKARVAGGANPSTPEWEDAVRLVGKGANEFELYSFPAVKWAGIADAQTVGIFSKVTSSVPEIELDITVDKFNHKKWLIKVPESSFEGLNDIYAKVDFEGLICRIFDQNTGMLEGDQYWAEALDWNVGLKRFKTCLADKGLVFYANPSDRLSRKELSPDGMTLEEKRVIGQDSLINGITFTPEYKLVLKAE